MKIKHAMSNLVVVISHSELLLALGYIPKLHKVERRPIAQNFVFHKRLDS
jgi:hypothetical protein